MLTYHRAAVTKQLTDLLDYLSLQSLRYNGMLILKFIMQIKDYFSCSWSDLCRYTCSKPMELTWNRFFNHACTWMKKRTSTETVTDLEKYWYYARNFKGTAFPELSFSTNQYSCRIFAIILDKIQDSETRYDRKVLFT